MLGLGLLVFFLPMNAICWNVMEKYQRAQMKQKDIRVNLVNEILTGIKVMNDVNIMIMMSI